jgi:hypothetical protein
MRKFSGSLTGPANGTDRRMVSLLVAPEGIDFKSETVLSVLISPS